MRDVTLVNEVAEALRKEILGDRRKPGSRLEGEWKLVRRFGVARVVVREAIARLRAQGLVRPEQGRGIEVLDWRTEAGVEVVPALLGRGGAARPRTLALVEQVLALPAARRPPQAPGARTLALLEQVLALRRAIAADLVSEAARRRSNGGLVALRRAVARARKAAGGPADAFMVADMEFARALADAAGNLPARLLANSVARAVAANPAFVAAMYADPAKNAAGLEAALAAVEAGDPDAAAALVRALLDEADRETLARLRARSGAARKPAAAARKQAGRRA